MKNKQLEEEPDPKAFERFRNLTKKLVAVPKKELDAAAKRLKNRRKTRH